MAELVAGRYRIMALLGEGGMGEVYSAHDERLKRDVAIKRLHVYGANQTQLDTFHARFEREAISMAQFIHPYIVPVYDFGTDEDGVYLVMGLMTGGALKDRMGKIMPVQQAAQMIVPIADALGYVHARQLVHRDVKPHNILFNEHDVPMLSDFGIVKLVESDGVNLTSTGTGVGTPAYMAPEQMTTRIDARADQYSLGIILYEMLTGRIPFEGETPVMTLFLHRTEPLPDPRLFAPTLSDAAVAVLKTALAKDPADRYPTMQAFAKALQAAASEAPRDVLAAEAGFVQPSEAVEQGAGLNQTMVGAPSMFTHQGAHVEEEGDAQSIEAFIRDSDEFEAEESPSKTVNAVSLNADTNIQQAFDVPVDEVVGSPQKLRGKDRPKKKDRPTGEKKKRRIPRWMIAAAPIVFILCLVLVLLQQCSDLGDNINQLIAQGTDQPLGEIIANLSNDNPTEAPEDLMDEPLPVVDIEPQVLLIVGDPALQDATAAITELFLQKYPGWRVDVAGGGSLLALTAISTDKADIGMSRGILSEQEWERFPKIKRIPVAFNTMGVLCNEKTTVTDLTLNDLRRILAGEAVNWNEFGGPDAPINIYVGDFDNDATQAFTMIVMGEGLITSQIESVGSPEQVVEAVKGDPNGIGILNRMVETGNLHYISVNGVEPNEQNVRSGRYPLAYQYMYVTHGEPDEKESIFFEFVYSQQGAEVLRNFGLVPIKLEDMAAPQN